MKPTAECYCNSHRHTVAEHPVAGCLVPGCECARLEEPEAQDGTYGHGSKGD